MKRVLHWFIDIYKDRYVLSQLTGRSVLMKYKNSYLGIMWAFLEPVLFVLVLSLVFGIGLKSGRNMSIPFICYLVAGMAVVNYFNQTLNQSVTSIQKHSYLLKKVNIRHYLLPISTILTGLVDHFFFLIAAIFIFLINGIPPTVYWFQVVYYMFALNFLVFGAILFTSSVGVFFKDLKSIISVFTRMLFYFTPVIWDYNSIPEDLQFWVKLNPLFYIAMGYRDSFYYNIPFWSKPALGIYYWSFTLIVLLTGTITYRRLRPQFGDFV